MDASGDVVYIQGGGAGNLTSTCTTVNQVPKMSGATSLACSQIFDDGTSVVITPTLYPLSSLIKLEVKGSVSIYDGTGSNNNGDNSLFFGREQTTLTAPATDLGEWGIQYTPPGAIGNPVGGINFWKPFGSDGGFGNNFLYLSNNGNVGIGTPDPINRAEITSGSTVLAPVTSAVVTRSGLRFTDLTATMVVDGTANSSNTFLSVNDDGDVILVPGSPFFFGGTCANTNTMTSDFEIPMGSFNFIFSGQGANVTNVGIGMPSGGCVPSAKLEILQSSITSGAVAERITNSSADGLGMDMKVNGAGASHTGIQILVQSASNNTGVSSTAFGGNNTSNGGVFKGISASSFNNGVVGSANGSVAGSTNSGGRFFASSNPSGTINYGIYAESLPVSTSSFAARFEGNIMFNGTLSGTNNVMTSDQMFKTNINPISNATQLIASLQPKTFYFDTLNQYGMNFSSAEQYGLVAQDVEQTMPELVSETFRPALLDSANQVIYPSVTYKSLNYNAFIAILIKGMQEQNAKIDSLQNQINSCCANNSRIQDSNTNQTDVHLSDIESIVLNQNVPNPFAEQTTISYNLPETVQKAQLLFYDSQGKLIKAVELTSRGKGQVNVFADDLTSGIYSYALIADGQIADTKRMVKIN